MNYDPGRKRLLAGWECDFAALVGEPVGPTTLLIMVGERFLKAT